MPRSTSRRNRRTGAGYLMPAEYYNPSARQPSGPNTPTISAAPVTGWVRPPIAATSVIAPAGGKRRTMKGGFAASIMGAFAANAQTAIVPLVLLGLYGVFGAKRQGVNSTRKANSAKPVSSNKANSSSKSNNKK
jgi:hypothetical protein